MNPTRRQFVKVALAGTAILAAGGAGQAIATGISPRDSFAWATEAGKNGKGGEWKTVKVSDSTEMKLFVARPKAEKAPGVIVLQEIFGVNPYIRSVVLRIAALGYVVAAPDLFHRTSPSFESGYTDMNPGIEQMKKMTDASLELDLKATYDFLTGDKQVDAGQIGSVGFCMGGRASFFANAVLPLQAAAVYYGGGIADTLLERAKDQHGPLLIFSGGKDTHIGREKQNAIAAALKEAGKHYADIEFSEAEHGFFCDQRGSYNPEAAAESWELLKEFFRQHLKD